MGMVLCENGHFFDNGQSYFCPVCGKAAVVENEDDYVRIHAQSGKAPSSGFMPGQEVKQEAAKEAEPKETSYPAAGETTVLSGLMYPGTAPSQKAPAYQAPSQQTPVYQSPSQQTPAYQSPSQQAPVYQAPPQQAPAPDATTVISSSSQGQSAAYSYQTAPHQNAPVQMTARSGGQYCYYCFKKHTEPFVYCPYCGEENNGQPKLAIQLAPGTMLQNRYLLGRAVGQGGFGVVYKAFDTKLEVVVAIKEYFPRSFSTRAPGTGTLIVTQAALKDFEYFKKRFLAEARTMARFGNHRSIPNVFEFFEENNTTYFVMEYLEGISLKDYIIETRGQVDQSFACFIATEVAAALCSLHKANIIHRDVAPDNIFICRGETPRVKLMDLGAAKLTDGTDDGIDRVMKPGFSPPEQYDEHGNVGPWTDIYALGATLYTMLTGVKPDESTNRKIETRSCSHQRSIRISGRI